MRIVLKDRTGTIDLKYLLEDSDRHGNVRLYARRGRKIRLKKTIGTEEFLEEYKEALVRLEKKREPSKLIKSGSFHWLAVEYMKSAEFHRLDPATQTLRRRVLNEVCLKHGTNPVSSMARKHVKSIRDEKAEFPHAANTRLKTLRTMFKWAVDAELINQNPAREVSKIIAPSDGHHTWTMGEVLRFMKAHPASTKPGLAFALMYYLMVRRSDVVKLGRQMENGETLRLIETKGHARKLKVTELAIHPELRAVLDQHKSTNLTYLTTEYGKPFSAKGFGAWFKKHCVKAGLGHCTAHGIRKGSATIAADRGANEFQIMSIGGWANPKEAATYTRQANRKKLAGEAANLLSLGDRKLNKAVPQKKQRIK